MDCTPKRILAICTLLLLSFAITACQAAVEEVNNSYTTSAESKSSHISEPVQEDNHSLIHPDGKSIEDRFNVPAGYERLDTMQDSFAYYLRQLPLKPYDSQVTYYDGSLKRNNGIYEAVVDMDIGTKDLQQCADAVMRLRGEYLYHKGDFDSIQFNLTNGFKVDYSKWMEGYRVAVDGNTTSWVKKKQPSNSYDDFRAYMEFVFIYAGTLSLEKELKPVSIDQMQIGDVLIQGGSPGHAVIVVDMAENADTGEKVFMLVQSYMPAQDIQVLANPKDDLSPWYVLNKDQPQIVTPEWTFTVNDLRRF